ncbi:hypothetical protein [uncultured Treponema sp.]|uniref:hypothetical protein n=1 Tax=uncultured Treponema sp. TaxID=162155 RepID=UPI0025E29E86|nr:hypothetical protein [uncultured Treponema sp.]
MKKFFSPQILTESNDLFASLIDLIDKNYIRDKKQILSDILFRESLKGGKSTSFGKVFVHTARTSGISAFCLACSQSLDGHLEILLLWNEMTEHILDKLSKISHFLQKSAKKNFTSGQIICELKKL